MLPGNDWRELPTAALTVFTLGGLVSGTITGALFGAIAWAVMTGWVGGIHPALVSGGILSVFAATGAWRGWFRWHHTRWRLVASGLEVRVGRFWQSETLVPRSRVQHLDIDRGPIERRYGLATLTIHTAGTRTAALSQPGLLDAEAVALRDALLPEANLNDDAL
jgi:membrane protein YdbS with pleckstrin-like domain